jgi:hypothetical protein
MLLAAVNTPLSVMDPETMRAVYNSLAAGLKKPPAPKLFDRFEFGKGIALMRATPKPKDDAAPRKKTRREAMVKTVRAFAPRPSVIRDAALAELARVVAYQNTKTGKVEAADFFEAGNVDGDEWVTMGATYAEVCVTVRKQIKHSRITTTVLRRFVHHIKKVAVLEAQKRPVPPALEAYRNVVLPERRPKPRTVGVPNARPDKPSARKPARPFKLSKRGRAKLSAKRSAAKRGRANNRRIKRS